LVTKRRFDASWRARWAPLFRYPPDSGAAARRRLLRV